MTAASQAKLCPALNESQRQAASGYHRPLKKELTPAHEDQLEVEQMAQKQEGPLQVRLPRWERIVTWPILAQGAPVHRGSKAEV